MIYYRLINLINEQVKFNPYNFGHIISYIF